MARAGVIALPVILVLGGITGYLTYGSFTEATPDPGIVESPYWKPLSESSSNQSDSGGDSQPIDESQYSDIVTINILEGSVVQGNPDYDPDAPTAGSDALITWVNNDNTLHTATSGSGPSDADSGKLFDTGFLNTGDKFSIPASEIGAGEHQFYCNVHPYMTSSITIQ